MKEIFKTGIKALLFLILTLSVVHPIALAGDARLFLSPSSGNYYIGSSFAVGVFVDSGSHQTNAYKAVVRFPTALLSVSTVSVSGAICTLQITGSPSYSNSAGTVSFECGHTGSFSGSAGRIGTISFTPKATGTANLSITSGQIKAADGSGTEVLGSTGGAAFVLQNPPVSPPAVSSSTHADQNSWYAKDDVVLSWTRPSGAVDFSYTLDRSPQTIPNNLPNGTGLSMAYYNLSDGIHYFHVKSRGSGGWSQTTHFKIRVDVTPPEPFELSSKPPAELVTAAPLISGRVRDLTSGISHYESSLDEEVFKNVPFPYQFARLREGNHVLVVRAFDKAGNWRESSLLLKVIDIQEPIIIQPKDGSFLPILEKLKIRGTAPEGLVELRLNGEFLTLVESQNGFYYDYPEFLHPGRYTLSAVSITERGLESSLVEIRFTVDPRAISILGKTLPGWLVYSILLGTIAGLIFWLILLVKKRREREKHFVEDIENLEREVNKILKIADEEANKDIEEILRGGRSGRILRLERRIAKTEGKAKESLINGLESIKRHHQIKNLDAPLLPKNIIVTGFLGDTINWIKSEVKKRKKVR